MHVLVATFELTVAHQGLRSVRWFTRSGRTFSHHCTALLHIGGLQLVPPPEDIIVGLPAARAPCGHADLENWVRPRDPCCLTAWPL
jgi:hypothetical protein